MDWFQLLKAVIQLGAPIAFLSWLMFSWMFKNDKLSVDEDRKALGNSLKELKKSSKGNDDDFGFLQKRWMRLGSGFYGLAALWTLFISELGDIYNFIVNFPGFAKLLADGAVALFISFLMNQIQNLITAFTWFNYWPDSHVWLWVIVAYLAYLLGIEIAKREYAAK